MAKRWVGPLWHSFRGKRYKIRFVPRLTDAGSCDPPDIQEKEIIIAMQHNKDPKEEINTMVHEALHAALWDLSEDTIDEVATSISTFLWRAGYRR